MILAAVKSPAQISSDQVRERYERNTRGVSIDDFVRRLNSSDPEERLEGVKSLAESRDPKAVEFLVQALGDTDMRIKAKAIDGLANLRASEATPVLIQHLFLRGLESSAKQRILAALGKIGDPRSVPPIVEFLQRDLDPAVQGTAIYALGEIGAREAVPALEKVRKESSEVTLKRLAGEAILKIQYQQHLLSSEAKEPQSTFLRDDRPR